MPQLIYRFKDFLRDRFSSPVRKLAIHTRLGCPHRDNRTGKGGCIYCYNPGFSNIEEAQTDVSVQIESSIEASRKRGYTGKYIAYFQTETNTFADISVLESWWRIVENFPNDFVGLSIGTRPDCLGEDVINLLSELGRTMMVWVELGLQSANDRTLELINRGHDYDCFVNAVDNLKKENSVLICSHIIMGLPGETYDDMLHTIQEINRLELHGVKIHHLQVVKHTVLADWYEHGNVDVYTEDEYIDLIVRILPNLSPEVCVHRLVGDIQDNLLIAPRWQLAKPGIIQLIENKMRQKGVYQGMNL